MLSLLLALFYVFFKPLHGLSACDEVDIAFLIDNNFILNDLEDIKHFILSIIWDGSSEYSSFSIYLYGNNIPESLENNIQILDSVNTYSMKRRDDEQQAVVQALDSLYNTLNDHMNDDSSTGSDIPLETAFDSASNSELPQHEFRKRSFLKNNQAQIGDSDGNRIYFVFDFTNELLSLEANDEEFCEIISYFEENSDNEYLHLIMGEVYNTVDIICNDEIPDIIDNRFIFEWVTFFTDEQSREQILDLTCPAKVVSEEFHGSINVGNHVQFIDNVDLVNECNEVWINDEKTQIDSSVSYMQVKNYYDDDMTFQIGDYLLFDHDTYFSGDLDSTGCTQAVYKIQDIEENNNNNNDDDYEILNLYVSLPQSPMEYIMDCDLSKNNMDIKETEDHIDLDLDNDEYDDDRRRRMETETKSESTNNFELSMFPFRVGYHGTVTNEGSFEVSDEDDIVTFSGEGTIEVKYGASIEVDMSLDFEFYWNLIGGDLKLYYQLHGYALLNAYFIIKLDGSLRVDIQVFKWAPHSSVIWIGYFPLVIKPFVDLTVGIETVPLQMTAGINCTYKESFKSGYYYEEITTVHPEFGLLAQDRRFTVGLNGKEWTSADGITTANECASIAYEYGAARLSPCKVFQWNDITKTCKCNGDLLPSASWTTPEYGTDIYLMGYDCEHDFTVKGWTFIECNIGNGGYFIEKECSWCDGLWNTLHRFRCRKCPLFQANDIYRTKEIIQYNISESEVIRDECLPIFEIGDTNDDECDNEYGFNVILSLRIGAVLYELIQVYLRPELTIPLRMQLPTFDRDWCGFDDSVDMYAEDLYLSFSIACYLSLYVGVGAGGIVGDKINEVVTENTDIDDLVLEGPLFKDLRLFGPLRMGPCIQMTDVFFNDLNAYFIDQCSPANSIGSSSRSHNSENTDENLSDGNWFSDSNTAVIGSIIIVAIIIFVVGIIFGIWWFYKKQNKSNYKNMENSRELENVIDKEYVPPKMNVETN